MLLNNSHRSHMNRTFYKIFFRSIDQSLSSTGHMPMNYFYAPVTQHAEVTNHCLYKCNHCVTNPFLAVSYCIGGIAIGSHGKGMSVGMNGSKWKSIKIIITWNLIVFVGVNLEIKLQLVLGSFFSCNRYLLLPAVTKSKKIIKI